MCSVIGFITKKPLESDLRRLQAIWVQSRIRGLHAFGFTVLRRGELETTRSGSFLDTMNALQAQWPFEQMIGHCRYSTSGDWMSEENNQPIRVAQHALVFNGVVSMKLKAEMEQEFGFTLDTDNDGEVALREFIARPGGFARWLDANRCSFAGLIMNSSGVMAYRNERRPLWQSVTPTATFIASTSDILARANVGPADEMAAGYLVRSS